MTKFANTTNETTGYHPAWKLIGRYLFIFRTSWKHRHDLTGQKRLADEAEFLPAALSLQETPVHPAPRRLALALIVLFSIALVWSIFGHIDIVAIAPGRIVVSERTKLIQPLSASVVKKVLVRDGDHVVVGQPLVELDSTFANADKSSTDNQLKSAESESIRTRALLQAIATSTEKTPDLKTSVPASWTTVEARAAQSQLEAEWSDINAKLAKADSEISRRQAEIVTVREMATKLESTLPIAKQRESDFKKLTDQGFMSAHANQDRTRERIELERDLITLKAKLLEANATFKESLNSKKAYMAEIKRLLKDREANAELKRSQGMQEQTKAAQRASLTTLSSPVSGIVQQLAAHTEGGVVTEAQPLMVIVPDDAQITAEVFLENKDIGFVEIDQAAVIKLETFNFTRYGTVNATVKSVTADAVNDEKKGAIFPAILNLQRNLINVDGKNVKLSPGMNVTAEIKTGSRRIIEFLANPVYKHVSESLHER